MSEKRRSPLKLILMILGPILLLGGGFVGAALFGVVNVPGLTPAKKAKATAAAQELYTETTPSGKSDPEPVAKKPSKPKSKPVAAPQATESRPDPEVGAKQVARLWNGVPTKKLLKIMENWENADLARILRKMDPDKAVEVLGELDAKRASDLSRLIQEQSAQSS